MTMDHAPPKKCSLKIYIRLTGAQFWQNDLRFSNRLSFQASRSTGWFALEPVPLRPLPPIIRELDHLGAAPTGIWRGFQFSRFSHGQRMASTCWMVLRSLAHTPCKYLNANEKREKGSDRGALGFTDSSPADRLSEKIYSSEMRAILN